MRLFFMFPVFGGAVFPRLLGGSSTGCAECLHLVCVIAFVNMAMLATVRCYTVCKHCKKNRHLVTFADDNWQELCTPDAYKLDFW
jgi:hypothetical protein